MANAASPDRLHPARRCPGSQPGGVVVTTPPGTAPLLNVEDRRAHAEQVSCADIVDSLGRRHRHHAHLLDLVSPTPGRLLFGPAVTISFFPSCSAAIDPAVHDFRSLFRA